MGIAACLYSLAHLRRSLLILCCLPCFVSGQSVYYGPDNPATIFSGGFADIPDRSTSLLTDGTGVSSLKSLLLAKIFGNDDRKMVGIAETFPWSTVGMVVSVWGTSDVWLATGVLIGEKTVLTCAHNVQDIAKGWADTIYFIPGKTGSNEPYGRVNVVNRFTPSEWSKGGGKDPYDIAVLILQSAVGVQASYMEFETKSTEFLTRRLLNSAGYPGDKSDDDSMYYVSGVCDRVEGNLLLHTLDATSGQSGSPLWDYDDVTQKRVLVGVLSGSVRTVDNGSEVESWNLGVRITDSYFDWISALMDQYDPDTFGNSTSRPSSGDDDNGTTHTTLFPACGAGLSGSIVMAMAGMALMFARRRPVP